MRNDRWFEKQQDTARRPKAQRCADVMECYLGLDKQQRVPLSVTWHLLRCSKCRAHVAALCMAERLAAAPLAVPTPVTDEAVNAVLLKAGASLQIPAEKKAWPGRMAIQSWIIVGIIMLVSMVIFVAGCDRAFFVPSGTDKTVGLVFAVLITLYCVAFVAGNIDYFVKKTGIGLMSAA